MKILLLGKNGQVGWELQRALAPLGELRALGSGDEAGGCGDLRQIDRVAADLRAWRPDVIVNAAAYTAVDRAESEPALAQQINGDAPGRLAREAAALNAWLVHFSTDYVFDGAGDQPRDEAAATGPLNRYGHSKLDGERQIIASGCRHLILRTSWVYAARGGNFARTMLRLAAERDRLRVIDDQIGAPTGADLLADLSAHAIRRLQVQPDCGGLYHVAAAGETSWHGYARFVIDWARQQGQTLRTAPDHIEPVPSSAYPTAARRPLNSRLATSRFKSTFGLHLPDWRVGVERMLREVLGNAEAR